MPLIKTARTDQWIAEYSRGGENPTALIIHGAGGSHLSFPAELRHLKIVDPVLVDLNGHGKSPGRGHDSVEKYAEDLVDLLVALDIDSAIVIGHSMGGAIAQTLALEYTKRVRALVLIATAAKFAVNPALKCGIVDDHAGTLHMLDRRLWAPETPAAQREQASSIMRQTDVAVFQRDIIACERFDLRRRLPEIRCSTLILAGDADKMTSLALSQELAQGIPHSKLVQFSGGSHMFMLEQPLATTQSIESWIQDAT